MGKVISNNIQNYFEDSFRFAIEEISYKLERESKPEEKKELVVSDSVTSEAFDNGITLHFSRIIRFEPVCIFSLKAVITADIFFKDGMKELFWKENIDIEESLKHNTNFLTEMIMSRLSLIISQLTSATGNSPIVTEPFLTENK